MDEAHGTEEQPTNPPGAAESASAPVDASAFSPTSQAEQRRSAQQPSDEDDSRSLMQIEDDFSPLLEGEWLCGVCGNVNYPDRAICHMNVCRAPRGFPGPFKSQMSTVCNPRSAPQAWICPNCNRTTRATRDRCRKASCGTLRTVSRDGTVSYSEPNPQPRGSTSTESERTQAKVPTRPVSTQGSRSNEVKRKASVPDTVRSGGRSTRSHHRDAAPEWPPQSLPQQPGVPHSFALNPNSVAMPFPTAAPQAPANTPPYPPGNATAQVMLVSSAPPGTTSTSIPATVPQFYTATPSQGQQAYAPPPPSYQFVPSQPSTGGVPMVVWQSYSQQ